MSSLREVQLCGLSILKEVVKVCDNNNLTYYLSCGTLLGAVRHKGFIPWDNDIDIEMPVEDYRKFLKIAQKELPANLFLQTYQTDPGYNEMWAKVRVNGTTSLPIAWKSLNIHWGIGIDIFPLVGIYEHPALRKLQLRLHGFCRTLLAKDFVLATNPKELTTNPKLRLLYSVPRSFRILACKLAEPFLFKNIYKSSFLSMVADSIQYPISCAAYTHTHTIASL